MATVTNSWIRSPNEQEGDTQACPSGEAPAPERGSLIDLGGARERIGREIARCPADRKAAEMDDYERRQAKRIADAEALFKKIRASG